MQGNIEQALLLRTLQPKSTHDTTIYIDPAINWDVFYKYILRHRVWHQVHKALLPLNIQNKTMQALTKKCQQDKHRILIMAGETVRIARAFTAKSIKHCFVKGTLLNMHLYGGLVTRPCNDIDVWVDNTTYSNAIDVLISLGYQKKHPTYPLEGFKKEYYLRHHHDIAFYHPTQQVLVELHFRLSYFAMEFFPLSSTPLQPIKLMNTPILAPDDDHHLLYLMLHGATHAWIRLRWLQDIALFIEQQKCDLDRIMALASELHCEHIVEQSFLLAKHFFNVKIPLIQPSQRSQKLVKLAQQFIAADYEMTDGIKNPILFFKYRFYLGKLAVHHLKVRAVLNDLFKIDYLFPYITFPKNFSFMYYVCYSLWVIRYVMKHVLAFAKRATHS